MSISIRSFDFAIGKGRGLVTGHNYVEPDEEEAETEVPQAASD